MIIRRMETEDRIMGKQDARLIIFDMDGVILDSEPLHENARQMMFKNMGSFRMRRCRKPWVNHPADSGGR